MQTTSVNYSRAALGYLHNYYQSLTDENLFFGFPFIEGLVEEATEIAKAEGVNGVAKDKALMVVAFRFAGIQDIISENNVRYALLEDFADQINYSQDDCQWVESCIRKHSDGGHPDSVTEQVAWDALASRFAIDDLIVHVSFLKDEMSRISGKDYTEMAILSAIKEGLVHSTFYTDFAKKKFAQKKSDNYLRLDKRMQKLEEVENKSTKSDGPSNLSTKETEDLFKIAFRNYVNLVSVADKKAGLLLSVNSIIVSVVIAFVFRNAEQYRYLLPPFFVLLGTAFLTILLSIMASRPQSSNKLQDRHSKSYQTFFFGSFDLVGSDFFKASWQTYSTELDGFLKGDRERVYEEMYKEAFNVRKVLGRKFTYLSIAYWVFLGGLFLSIVLFLVNGLTHNGRPPLHY